MIDRTDCLARDETDPLNRLREQFATAPLDTQELIYLDGNSLGVPPRAVADGERLIVEHEWGAGLIRSWNTAGWINLPERVGDKIARLVGAGPAQLTVADSTSIDLAQGIYSALAIVAADFAGAARSVSEQQNFPSELPIADGVARAQRDSSSCYTDGERPVSWTLGPPILLLSHGGTAPAACTRCRQ